MKKYTLMATALGTCMACAPSFLSAAQSEANAAEPSTSTAAADTDPVKPFAARYEASWKGLGIGTSEISLKKLPEADQYLYTWTITARGIFRIAYSDDLVQKSWLTIHNGHAQPVKYRGSQGSSSVNIDFDWNTKRATGESEKKPVDIALKDGTQDVMSIQVEVMADLRKGNLPKTFWIIDKDQLKEFIYTQEGSARIRTEIGELDTVVVTSQRAGNNRILRMWFAPSLGFLPVQAERSRDGKVEIAMRIKSAG
jgi:Protein of unknown function (DUF3108)